MLSPNESSSLPVGDAARIFHPLQLRGHAVVVQRRLRSGAASGVVDVGREANRARGPGAPLVGEWRGRARGGLPWA